MPRPFEQDPTRFFTVVGAPYIAEHHHADACRREPMHVGVGALAAAFFAAVIGLSLLSDTGFARIVEVAQRVVR